MARTETILIGVGLVLLALPGRAAGATSGAGDIIELDKWVARLWPSMLAVGALVAIVLVIALARLHSPARKAIAIAVAVVVGAPLVVGVPLVMWNLAKSAPVMADVRVWNRIAEEVHLTDGQGRVLQVPACDVRSAVLDAHRMSFATPTRGLNVMGGGLAGIRLVVVEPGRGGYLVDAEPARLHPCEPIPR